MSFFASWRQSLSDINHIFREELRTIIHDKGVIIFFFLVPLGYPLLYAFIYSNEVVREVPITIVDDCRSGQSREYVRHLDATPDVKNVGYSANMEEAKKRVKHREVYGIVHIPSDFSSQLNKGQQVYVGVYADMSGMLYYKNILTANTNVSLDMNASIKVRKAGGTTKQQDLLANHPIHYEEVYLFNPQNGFAAFLIPAVLILIIQQTLLLGIGMAAGTAREHNHFRNLVSVNHHNRGLLRIVVGKGFAYMLVYIPLCIYVLGVIPHLFRLNQLGNFWHIVAFIQPFLIASIFFAMTMSAFVRHREMCIILIVFTSVPLLFISGISWPGSAVPEMWKAISYVFPSTFGIHGFIAINNMGASLADVEHDWYMLWVQAIIYTFTTCAVYKGSIAKSRQNAIEDWRTQRQ